MSNLNSILDEELIDISDGGTGVEEETVDTDEEIITEPFDPSLIRVSTKFLTIGQLVDRIKEGALDLSPDFQRNFVWKPGAQSRLIESMFIRFPLPAFYMDATDDDRWLVVDGLQRLTTVQKFVIEKTLALTELEFLSKEYRDKTYDELPPSLKRRINETQVTVYLIEKGTPPDVKFNIFKRINTGGLPLSPQEIRHAINQGEVTKFLAKLAHSKEFEKATSNSIRDRRMEAREMVLRFLAFSITPYTAYSKPDLDSFLNNKMAELNEILKDKSKRDAWEQRFKRAMDAAYNIFGEDAFRKRYDPNARRLFVNKALFESWSVNLDQLNEKQLNLLIERKEQVRRKFIDLMNTPSFNNAISQGTGGINKVKIRFQEIEKLVAEVLG
jgi:uncharacterized protein with ParB-like and HNH nuclease domain